MEIYNQIIKTYSPIDSWDVLGAKYPIVEQDPKPVKMHSYV